MSLNSFGTGLRTGWAGKVVFGILALGMGVTAFTGLGAILTGRNQIGDSSTPQQQPASEIIATVNGAPITRATFENIYARMKQQQEQYQPVGLLSAGYLRGSALQQIETHLLTAQIAKQQGISVTDKDLSQEKEKIYASLRPQLSLSKTASADDINAALQQHGTSLDAFAPEDALKQDILAQKYQDALTKTYTATDQDVQAYYHQVHTRHILIDNKKRPDAQAKDQAQQLIAKIKAGGDFVALARQYSDDPGTKMKGGDDGFIDQSTQYVQEFKDAALKLTKGQVTDQPVLSPQYGYFVIQATDVRENLPKDYGKKKALYTTQVSQGLQQKQQQADLTAAQKAAKIVGIDPETKGDIAFQQAGTQDATDTAKRNADLNAALTAYDTALKSASPDRQAEIHAQRALIYQNLTQPDKEMPELVAALKYSPDPQGLMQLGDLYKQKGDVKDALAQYKLASDSAYDNPFIHMQLSQSYRTLNQPLLAAKEQALFKDGQARQQQAMAMPQITMPSKAKK